MWKHLLDALAPNIQNQFLSGGPRRFIAPASVTVLTYAAWQASASPTPRDSQ